MDTFLVEFRAMGCGIDIRLQTQADGEAILGEMPEKIEEIEAKLSRFRPDSELMQLNEQAGQWVHVSDTLLDVVHMAKHGARRTEGLFNPLIQKAMLANGYDRSFENIASPETQPASVGLWQDIEIRLDENLVRLPEDAAIDLGGIAKGWTAARIASDLSAYGACLVNIGGDIVVRGKPDDSAGWMINLQDPQTQDVLFELCLRDTCVMTSGVDYRHWVTVDGQLRHHIIDPRTGASAHTDIETVTVVHPHAPTAEVYTKAVLLLGGDDGLAWLSHQVNAAGLIVRTDGAVLSTENFNYYIQERI